MYVCCSLMSIFVTNLTCLKKILCLQTNEFLLKKAIDVPLYHGDTILNCCLMLFIFVAATPYYDLIGGQCIEHY